MSQKGKFAVDRVTWLTAKEKKFADKIMEWIPATQAVLETYDTTSKWTAASIATDNLNKAKIQDYLQSLWHKARSLLERVMDWDEIGGEKPKLQQRIDIAITFDDKAFGRATQKQEISGKLSLDTTIDISTLTLIELEQRRKDLLWWAK